MGGAERAGGASAASRSLKENEMLLQRFHVGMREKVTDQSSATSGDSFTLHDDLEALHEAWPNVVTDKRSRVVRVIAATISTNNSVIMSSLSVRL